MTEKLFTGTLNHNQNKNKKTKLAICTYCILSICISFIAHFGFKSECHHNARALGDNVTAIFLASKLNCESNIILKKKEISIQHIENEKTKHVIITISLNI